MTRQGGPLTIDSVIIDTPIIGEVDQADGVEDAFLTSRRLVAARRHDNRKDQEGPGRHHSGDCTENVGELPDGRDNLPRTRHLWSGLGESGHIILCG